MTTRRETLARVTAGLIAAAVLLALLPPLSHAWSGGVGLIAAIWGMLRMFTIITNLLVGLVFARIACAGTRSVPAGVIGAIMLAIVLVGVVFNLVLAMLPHQTLWDAIGDYTHHVAAPIMVPAWWIAFAPHGRLRWSAPLVWALYPLGYAGCSFARALFLPPGQGMASRYPYFFLDLDRFGALVVARNMLIIALGFVLTGLIVVALDRALGPAQKG